MTTRNTLTTIDSFQSDLKLVKELVFDPCGFDMSSPKLHSESTEYGACSFSLNGMKIQYRVSKITPKKVGQFVSIWKRNQDGITAPFDISDDIDFIIITTKCDEKMGHFIFPKAVLVNKGVVTTKGKGGKRGIRVYPPWDLVTNKQAAKTQIWQMKYFLPIQKNNKIDIDLAKKLFTETNESEG